MTSIETSIRELPDKYFAYPHVLRIADRYSNGQTVIVITVDKNYENTEVFPPEINGFSVIVEKGVIASALSN